MEKRRQNTRRRGKLVLTKETIKEWNEQEWKDTERKVEGWKWVEAQKKEIEKGAVIEYARASKEYQENKSRWDEMEDD